jgi:hypothetical protein
MPLIRKLFTNRLAKRLDLEGTAEEKGYKWFMPKQIFAMISVDDLLKMIRSRQVASFTVTATGTKDIFTVPWGKRYIIYALRMVRQSGDGTVSNVYLKTDEGAYITLSTFASSDSPTWVPPVPYPLDEGMTLATTAYYNTTASDFNVYMFYAEEDAF